MIRRFACHPKVMSSIFLFAHFSTFLACGPCLTQSGAQRWRSLTVSPSYTYHMWYRGADGGVQAKDACEGCRRTRFTRARPTRMSSVPSSRLHTRPKPSKAVLSSFSCFSLTFSHTPLFSFLSSLSLSPLSLASVSTWLDAAP